MHPYFNLFGFDISAYGIFTALGAMAAALYIIFTFRGENYKGIKVAGLGLGWGIGVLFGGKILYFLTRLPEVLDMIERADTKEKIWDAYIFGFSGLVFYGGLLGGLLMTVLLCKLFKMNTLEFLDYMSPAIPLFHAFGRVGCFFTGCCYGISCKHGFTMTQSLLPSGNGVPRFPVQLLEGAINVVLFIILFIIRKKPAKNMRRGDIIFTYLLSYSICRFILEYFRGDALRGLWFSLSTSQWIGVILIIVTLVHVILFRKKQPKLLVDEI